MAFTPTDLKSNIYDNTYQKYETLGARIDYAWSVMIDDQQHDEHKNEAQLFLIYAFDLRELTDLDTQLMTLMKERDQYKKNNPDFVPGKAPKNLSFDTKTTVPSSESHRNGDDKLRRDINNQELLRVNDKSKLRDLHSHTTFFTPEGRAVYRVHLRNGTIQKNNKNFDTHGMVSHDKGDFGAYTLNSNGELSVFNHYRMEEINNRVLAHSSMNAGAPVVAAGEIKIENGGLKAITTHSGHYKPSLFNVYRLLEHFVAHNVDISEAEVFTFEDPNLPNIQSKSILVDGFSFYATKATDLFSHITFILKQSLDSISDKLQDYVNDEGFLTSLYTLKDLFLGSTLTYNRKMHAVNLANSIYGLKTELNQALTKEQKDCILEKMEKSVALYEQRNKQLSVDHDKKETNGRLADSFRKIKKEIFMLKQEDNEINSKMESRYKSSS